MNAQELKDKAAWALIYGGSSIAQWAIIAAAIASGFIDKTAARTMGKVASKMTPHLKDCAWRKYKETGSIADAFEEFF